MKNVEVFDIRDRVWHIMEEAAADCLMRQWPLIFTNKRELVAK